MTDQEICEAGLLSGFAVYFECEIQMADRGQRIVRRVAEAEGEAPGTVVHTLASGPVTRNPIGDNGPRQCLGKRCV